MMTDALEQNKLVFLPVTASNAGQEPEAAQSQPQPKGDRSVRNNKNQDHRQCSSSTGVGGAVKSWQGWMSGSMQRMWNKMAEKDPASFQNKIHAAGTRILENMTAEERLMRNIPSSATKVQ